MTKKHSGEALSTRAPLAWVIPNATVFVSSGCIMVIELVAGRLIARHLGSSIYTWTSVIGVVLAGIAIGNYIGGLLADRFAAKRTLAVVFMLSAVLSAMISLMDHAVGQWLWLGDFSHPMRVATHVALVFFPPSAMLGAISPVVAKMALDLGYRTGQTIGSVYAWGVVGSIVGTFATGFWLIAWFGTAAIVWGVSGVLAVMAVLYAVKWWQPWGVSAVLACFAVLANGPWAWAHRVGETLYLRERLPDNLIYADESQYSYVRVVSLDIDRNMRALYLDVLLHSQVDTAAPTKFIYGYEKVCAAITERARDGKQFVNTLTIGGGGYVYPRYMELTYPGSRTDAVEIDPAVTRAAHEAFGLPEDTSIRTFHEDGRVFVDRMYEQIRSGGMVERYDFVYTDAVNNVAVPHQLTTVEFARKIHELLTPDGVYLVNTIDILDHGAFVGSMLRTIQEVFPNVYVFTEGEPLYKSRAYQNTFIIAGSNLPLDVQNLSDDCAPDCRIHRVPETLMSELLQKDQVRVLTDDYAPVENLLASVVRETGRLQAIEERSDRHNQRALELYQEGQLEQAVVEFHKALRISPDFVPALFNLGLVYYQLDRIDDARLAFRQTTELYPTKVDAWCMLGHCHARKGDFERARRCYGRALELFPNHPETLKGLDRVRVLEARPPRP